MQTTTTNVATIYFGFTFSFKKTLAPHNVINGASVISKLVATNPIDLYAQNVVVCEIIDTAEIIAIRR